MPRYAKFLIIVLLSVITQTSTKALDDCNETKKANLDLEIENSKLKLENSELQLKISKLQLENSLLKGDNFKLSEQNMEFSTQKENCTAFAENIDAVSASLVSIQQDLRPLSKHFHLEKTNIDPVEDLVTKMLAENQKVISESFKSLKEGLINRIDSLEEKTNSVVSQQCLAELKTAKDDLATVTIQANNISTSLNTYLNEFKTAQKPLLPKTCKEAANDSVGIFDIQIPNSNLPHFPVYCDSDNWMVILRRVDGKIDFQRGWSDYKEGFGNLTGNFIMGLEKIHQITKSQCHELKIVVEDFANQKKFALYDKFGIDDENNGYALKTLGDYSGSAGEALLYHKDKKFSTIDKDNDLLENENCAHKYTGGWWYSTGFDSHLTGQYLAGGSDNCKGIDWDACSSLKFAQMMIRPTSC